MSELLNTFAFIFKRAGGRALSRQDLANIVSLDLRWFPPKDAKRLVAVGFDHGLVTEEDGTVVPGFDPASVDVPVGFRPSEAVFEEAPSVVAEEGFLADVARAAGLDAETLRKEAEKEQARDADLNLDAAALLVAARRGGDVEALSERAMERLKHRA